MMELLTKIQDAIRNYYVLTDKVDDVIAALDARADELNPDLSPPTSSDKLLPMFCVKSLMICILR